jgi:hypothetical protein
LVFVMFAFRAPPTVRIVGSEEFKRGVRSKMSRSCRSFAFLHFKSLFQTVQRFFGFAKILAGKPSLFINKYSKKAV